MSQIALFQRASTLHRPCKTSVWSSRSLSSTSKPGNKQNKRDQNDRSPLDTKKSEPAVGNKISFSHFPSNSKEQGSYKFRGPPFLIPPERTRLWAASGLWTANVSPLMDPAEYCRKSAFYSGSPSRNGTLAARRLLEGKEKITDELRGSIARQSRRRNRGPPRAYALQGHGVPKQLLQAHVDMADSLLTFHKHAESISFRNSTGKLSLDTLRVKSGDGRNRLEAWRFPEGGDQQHGMKLYLTVMNRMTSILSNVLWQHDNPVTVNDNQYDDDFVATADSSPLSRTRLHWNVEMRRFTPDLLLPSSTAEMSMPIPMLTPVVEWTPPESEAAPGQMCVKLRGLPYTPSPPNRRRRKPVEVTLTFRACFANPLHS